MRLRSDDQLVALFRAGQDEAFDVIHDRYYTRLFAYTRQMLPGRQDAEDAMQDVFIRAYGGLRASNRELALRAWLYRVAHNRCIDELRKPPLPAPELIEAARPPASDPIALAEQRDTIRQLIEDVQRLPEQQRSALLMREMSDMSYSELSSALDVSVPAIKSLLVRARVSLAKAAEARDTSCAEIQEELCLAHDRGVRPSGTARRHLRDCAGCRSFRSHMRGTSKQLAALVPALGPAAAVAKLIGFGGHAGGSGGGAAAASGGAAAAGGGAAVAGAGGVGGAATATGVLGGTHVATLIAAAVITAGGAVEIGQTITAPSHHARKAATHHTAAPVHHAASPAASQVIHSTLQRASATAPAQSPAPSHQAASHAGASQPVITSYGISNHGRSTPLETNADAASRRADGVAPMTAPASAYKQTKATPPPPTTTAPSPTLPGLLGALLGGSSSSPSASPASSGTSGATGTGSSSSSGSSSGTSSPSSTNSGSNSSSSSSTGDNSSSVNATTASAGSSPAGTASTGTSSGTGSAAGTTGAAGTTQKSS